MCLPQVLWKELFRLWASQNVIRQSLWQHSFLCFGLELLINCPYLLEQGYLKNKRKLVNLNALLNKFKESIIPIFTLWWDLETYGKLCWSIKKKMPLLSTCKDLGHRISSGLRGNGLVVIRGTKSLVSMFEQLNPSFFRSNPASWNISSWLRGIVEALRHFLRTQDGVCLVLGAL